MNGSEQISPKQSGRRFTAHALMPLGKAAVCISDSGSETEEEPSSDDDEASMSSSSDENSEWPLRLPQNSPPLPRRTHSFAGLTARTRRKLAAVAEGEEACASGGMRTSTDDSALEQARRPLPLDTLSPKHFIFIRQIGEGAFSTVYKVREVMTKNDYAIKVVTKSHARREQKTHLLVREKNVMTLLTQVYGGHPFIASLYCTFQDKDRIYFAMTYAARGDLLEMLKRVGSFDLAATCFYAAEIIAALRFIHDCGIAHRDVKPENILILANGHISLTDFGSAKILNENATSMLPPDDEPLFAGALAMPPSTPPASDDEADSENTEGGRAPQPDQRRATFVGTAQYVSPEMLLGHVVGPECDFWALGAVLFQMLSGQPPFRAVNDYHLMKKIQNLDFSFPDRFPSKPEDLIRKLLVIDPKERLGTPGGSRIEDHSFFAAIHFETLPQQVPPPLEDGEDEGETHSEGMQHETGLDEHVINRLMMMSLGESRSCDMPVLPGVPLVRERDRFKQRVKPPSVPRPTCPPLSQLLPGCQPLEADDADIGSAADLIDQKHTPGEQPPATGQQMRELKLQKQKTDHPYSKFVGDDQLILRSGLVDKKKGFFARRRMFLLTDRARVIYVDPVAMVRKGEIPMSRAISTEAKNFGNFFVHTPGRTYYLYDPARTATEWCEAIELLRDRYYRDPTPEMLAAMALQAEIDQMNKKRLMPPWLRRLRGMKFNPDEKERVKELNAIDKAERKAARKAAIAQKKAASEERRRAKEERKRTRKLGRAV